jgi:exopolysaccharide production protein ExoZ
VIPRGGRPDAIDPSYPPTPTTAPDNAVLRNLHLLRALAALAVVYFHITSTAGLDLAWDIGSRGVDVFFVISGFIIAYIGSKQPGQFFVRRLIRIVPFYWAATLVVFTAATLLPRFFRSTDASIGHLAPSLLFFPHLSSSGEVQPTLILGWSLNFEMFFYVLFALALLLSTRRAPILCAAAIVVVVAVGKLVGPVSTAFDFYARTTSLEFCYGIGAYYLLAACERHKTMLAQSTALKLALPLALIAGVAAIVLFEHVAKDTTPRYLAGGIPAFVIVVSALLLERIFGIASRSRLAWLLGEASYVIYLIHPYIVFGVLRLAVPDAAHLSVPMIVAIIAGLLALTSGIGIALHLLFEKPVMTYLRAKLTPDARPQAVAAA